MKWSGIINLLFDGFTDNTRGHFTHCSHFSSPLRARKNTTQLVKYPRVLSVKPSNKVYVLKSFKSFAFVGASSFEETALLQREESEAN